MVLASCRAATGRDYHVAITGNDDHSGSAEHPLRTISAATRQAEPGDAVFIHEGVYRERIALPRGGESDERRIEIRAAEGERVVVKGSEPVTGWEEYGDGLWKLVLDDSFFGEFNPFATRVEGGWLDFGNWHSLGDVYVNAEALVEVRTLHELRKRFWSWHAEVVEGRTVLYINVGPVDPRRELTEVNARRAWLAPDKPGLSYVSVRGIEFRHAASQWAPPLAPQEGGIATNGGSHWIIENCTIAYARAAGICIGNPTTRPRGRGRQRGHHVIRNNVIRRCGQAGIAGAGGWNIRSRIEGNHIDEINYRMEFGGQETAGIKLHGAVDVVIRGNLITSVYNSPGGADAAWGIWMDFACQNVRITGNVIYDTVKGPLLLEANHGPMLIDNNVFAAVDVARNKDVYTRASEATVYVHNLNLRAPILSDAEGGERKPGYHHPHALRYAGSAPARPRHDRIYNNIFARSPLRDYPADAEDQRVDANLYLQCEQTPLDEPDSVVLPFNPRPELRIDAQGVTLSLEIPPEALRMQTPLISSEFVGNFPLPQMSIANPDETPVLIDTDFFGNERRRPHPQVGPFSKLQAGLNEFLLFEFAGKGAAGRP